MSDSNLSDLNSATDIIVTEQLKHFYDTDKLGWEVISMSLGRTKKFKFTSDHNKAGYVWFVLYDLLGAVDQEAIGNPEIIVAMLNSLAKHDGLIFGELFGLFQSCREGLLPVDAFRKVYALVNEDQNELQDMSKDTVTAMNFIGMKLAERSLIAQLLELKL